MRAAYPRAVIIISIFKEDNVFSKTVNLPYSPPMNTAIDYFWNFLSAFCKFLDVNCSIFIKGREASACLIMLSTKQGIHWYHF